MQSILQFIGKLGFNEWLSLASACVAAISFLLSRKAVRRQDVMQFEGLRAQHDVHLIAWADAAIESISDAQGHCRDLKNGLLSGEQALKSASALRTRMSALLDRGRLFFPNQPGNDSDSEGDQEGAAYEGQAHPTIDALYRAYRVISDLGRDSPLSPGEAVKEIVAQRRRFVSEVFLSVDPRRRQAALSALDDKRKRT